MTSKLFAAALVVSLAGCQGEPANVASEANATANAASGENIAATVLGYSENQRNGVLARALIDAKVPCGTVLKSERVADINGEPAWRVHCKNAVFPVVRISADGTASFSSGLNP